MPRSFDVSLESPLSVERIRSAFANLDYWRARLAAFSDGIAALDTLNIDQGGTVSVVIRLSLLRDRLPGFITRLHRGDLQMVRNERWIPIADGRVRGEVSVAIPRAPLSVRGNAILAPLRNGSHLRYDTTVEVKVPLVGGKVESYIGGQLAGQLSAIQRFTTEWITEND
jgi:Protein of unknown function (DUF2505)